MLKYLELRNFRKFDQFSLQLSDHTVIEGPNGYGKTTIIEGIYWLIYGKSPFYKQREELIPHTLTDNTAALHTDLFSLVRLTDNKNNISSRVLTIKPSTDNSQIKLNTTLQVIYNDKSTTTAALKKQLAAVLFSPEYIDLLTLSRLKRLDWLDQAVSYYQRGYSTLLRTYNRIKRQRSAHIAYVSDQKYRGNSVDISLLITLTEQMLEQAHDIVSYRQSFISELNRVLKTLPDNLYTLRYQIKRNLDYDIDLLNKEITRNTVLIGPHLDDWVLEMKQTDSSTPVINTLQFGSRGQRKIGLIYLSQALIIWLQQNIGVSPLILLDDPSNELDTTNISRLQNLINTDVQVIETRVTD